MTFGNLRDGSNHSRYTQDTKADVNIHEQNSTFFITFPAACFGRLTFDQQIRPNPYISSKSARKFISKKVHFLPFGGLTKGWLTPIISSLPRKLERGFLGKAVFARKF